MAAKTTKRSSYIPLAVEDVLRVYDAIVEDFSDTDDPILPAGLKDRGLLESAVSRQQTSFGGVEKYRTLFEKAASLFYGLCNNHPFINGNKRCALVSMLDALDLNGYLLLEDDQPLFDLVTGAASHGLVPAKGTSPDPDEEVSFLAQWIHDRSRVVTRGERPLPFRTLRKLLQRFDCDLGLPDRGFIDVRKADRRFRLAYHGDGYEVTVATMAQIRRELELDEKHGIDSKAFYNEAGLTGAFIVKYRRVLRDLAHA